MEGKRNEPRGLVVKEIRLKGELGFVMCTSMLEPKQQ